MLQDRRQILGDLRHTKPMAKFQCPTFSSQLVIDLDAVAANYRAVRDHVSPSECGAVVKADAYGLGARRLASTLHREGCRIFFVAQLCEALDLRASLPTGCTIIILNGLDPGGEDACADWGFVPILNSDTQLRRWRSTARLRGRALPAGLQLDTGMSRLGLSTASALALAKDGSFADDLDLRLVMTHLACADEPGAAENDEQLRRFEQLTTAFPGVPRSIANSSGATLANRYHLDFVRAGIAIYGVPPRSLSTAIFPVVSLAARVLQIRELARGTGVGYGLTYVAPERRCVATLAVGYADGWPRSLGNVGAAWHRDVRLPIVGRVSMDSMTVDISAAPPGEIAEGGFVDLIGPNQSLEDIATEADTIPYELLTRLGGRHARAYIEGHVTTVYRPGEVH
jgi:alanine racemase